MTANQLTLPLLIDANSNRLTHIRGLQRDDQYWGQRLRQTENLVSAIRTLAEHELESLNPNQANLNPLDWHKPTPFLAELISAIAHASARNVGEIQPTQYEWRCIPHNHRLGARPNVMIEENVMIASCGYCERRRDWNGNYPRVHAVPVTTAEGTTDE